MQTQQKAGDLHSGSSCTPHACLSSTWFTHHSIALRILLSFLPGPAGPTLCGTSCRLHLAGIHGAAATPSPVPFCEDLAVSAGSVVKTGFVPVLEDYFIASSLQRSQGNRGGGRQEQGGEGSCLQLFLLSSPTEDVAEALSRAGYSSPAPLAFQKSHSLLLLVSSCPPLTSAKPKLPLHSLIQAKQVCTHAGLQLSSCLFRE